MEELERGSEARTLLPFPSLGLFGECSSPQYILQLLQGIIKKEKLSHYWFKKKNCPLLCPKSWNVLGSLLKTGTQPPWPRCRPRFMPKVLWLELPGHGIVDVTDRLLPGVGRTSTAGMIFQRTLKRWWPVARAGGELAKWDASSFLSSACGDRWQPALAGGGFETHSKCSRTHLTPSSLIPALLDTLSSSSAFLPSTHLL